MADRVTEGRTGAQVNGVEITTEPEENRVLLKYPRRLTKPEYKQVRSFGFVWTPTRKAFTRKMGGTRGAEYAARMLADHFGGSPRGT